MSDGNGENTWGVGFSLIMWLERILESNINVASVRRYNDIVFEVQRKLQDDVINILCINKYSASLEVVMQAIADFPQVNVIFYGGKWNKSTNEAVEFCSERNIGLYNAGQISIALKKNEYWKI